MPAKFKVTSTYKRSRFMGSEEPSYTATLVTNREIKAKEFSEILAKRTRISEIDCLKILMTISDEICKNLMEGNIVRVDHLGIFRITAKSTFSNTESGVIPQSLGAPKVVFTPSQEIKRTLSGIRYEKE